MVCTATQAIWGVIKKDILNGCWEPCHPLILWISITRGTGQPSTDLYSKGPRHGNVHSLTEDWKVGPFMSRGVCFLIPKRADESASLPFELIMIWWKGAWADILDTLKFPKMLLLLPEKRYYLLGIRDKEQPKDYLIALNWNTLCLQMEVANADQTHYLRCQ